MVASEQAVVTGKQLDTLSINTIRTLAIDAVQQANSGHPGAPMGLAPVAYCLWQEFLRYDPADPTWLNRDRFVLSNGHASMLLYALLYLAGVREVDENNQVLKELAVPLEEIKRFRQLGSRTPGHPESHVTSGIETTTGPLGQGVGNSVGMAIASKWLAANYNRPDFEIFDFNVYAMCSDGDLMEGIGGEAASLAGHLKLSNLCWIYDHNHVTLDGPASWSFSEDVATRFIGYEWNVTRVTDANDLEMLARAFEVFLDTKDRPTLIIVDSHIGYGSPHKQDTNAAHGEPLGEEEVRLTKKFYGWPEDAKFLVPEGVREHFQDGIGKRGRDLRAQWTKLFADYKEKYPELADQLHRMQRRELPDDWDKNLPTFPADPKGIATRESSGKVLNVLAQNIPWLIGGSADLATSNKTTLKFEGAGDFEAGNYAGRNLHFGVREHAMAASVNGLDRLWNPRLWRNFLQLQRLHAGQHPAGRAHGNSIDFYFHARLDWSGRRWSYSSTDRATRLAASDAEFDCASSGRCERSNRSLEDHRAVATPAGCAGTDTAKSANSGPHEVCRGVGDSQRRLHPGRRARRQTRCDSDGNGQRSFFMH